MSANHEAVEPTDIIKLECEGISRLSVNQVELSSQQMQTACSSAGYKVDLIDGINKFLFKGVGFKGDEVMVEINILFDEKKYHQKLKEKDSQNGSVDTLSGSYKSFDNVKYEFTIITNEYDKKNGATFSPFIPRDDKKLLEAIFQVFKFHYGPAIKVNKEPVLESRNGTNLIRFSGETGESYFVLTIKEDSGEVHTIIFWRE